MTSLTHSEEDGDALKGAKLLISTNSVQTLRLNFVSPSHVCLFAQCGPSFHCHRYCCTGERKSDNKISM